MEGFKPENLPIESGERIIKEREKLTLPAESIKNTVVWINPAFPEAPFKLEQGKPTKLALFFTTTPGKESKNLKISPEENLGRSGILGSVFFRDKDGILYQDVDLKGVGAFGWEDWGYKVIKLQKSKTEPLSAIGLMDYQLALRDKNYSEKFIKAGIRTHRVLAIVDLEEIITMGGRKIPIGEARNRRLISKQMHPVIEIRAFGTKDRINFLNIREFNISAAVEYAKKMIAQEQGKDLKKFSDEEYLKWFSRTLGKQVAILRKLRLSHNYLMAQNITLDCRIIDLDSVDSAKEQAKEKKISEDKVFAEDFTTARESLEFLASQVLSTAKIEHRHKYELVDNFLKIYEESYKKVLGFKK